MSAAAQRQDQEHRERDEWQNGMRMIAYAPYTPFLYSVSIVKHRQITSLICRHLPPPLFAPLQYDRSGRSTGQATMEFASPQQAKVAINKFDGAMTKGALDCSHFPDVRPVPPTLRRQTQS